MMAKLEARLDELSAEPAMPATVIYEPTGETLQTRYAKLTRSQRGDLLRRLEVQCTASKTDGVLEVSMEWGDLGAMREKLSFPG
jgi:hypothetical protein